MAIESLSQSIGPTVTPRTVAAQGNPTLGKEEFLKLLVAQLQNQDPLSPTNPEQMAAQLAQFSSLEQLITVNDNLTAQAGHSATLATSMNNGIAVGVLGQTVLAAGATVDISGAGDESVTAGVDGAGGVATLRVYDERGAEVASRFVGSIDGGRQEIPLGSIASELAPGRYQYELEVTGPDGEPVEVQTFSRVSIDGVRYGPNGPVLLSGGLTIPLADVAEILAQRAIS